MAYCTVDDLRAEGLEIEIADKALAEDRIVDAQAIIDKITGQFFEPVTGTFVFDGTNSHVLLLPLAVSAVTSLTINNGSTPIDTSRFRAFTGRQKPNDDRENPRIELRHPIGTTIFDTSNRSADFFRKGEDQTIVGTFGYLEPDGTVPRIIKRMCVAIVATMVDPLFVRFSGARGWSAGPLIEEVTDDHKLKWAASRRDVGDYVLPTAIENQLLLYKRPMAVGIPTVRWNDLGVPRGML